MPMFIGWLTCISRVLPLAGADLLICGQVERQRVRESEIRCNSIAALRNQFDKPDRKQYVVFVETRHATSLRPQHEDLGQYKQKTLQNEVGKQ